MKTLCALTLAISLTACGAAPSSDAQEGSAENTAAKDTAAASGALAADGAPSPGRYRAVGEDGSILIEELREDGTYTFHDGEGALLEEGAYVQKSSAEICFTSSAQGAEEICYAEEIGEDGIWRTIDPNTGMASVIERIDDE